MVESITQGPNGKGKGKPIKSEAKDSRRYPKGMGLRDRICLPRSIGATTISKGKRIPRRQREIQDELQRKRARKREIPTRP